MMAVVIKVHESWGFFYALPCRSKDNYSSEKNKIIDTTVQKAEIRGNSRVLEMIPA